MILFQFNTCKNLHFVKLLDEKNTALDSSTHMKLLNNFRQNMIFTLTSVFNVSRLQRQKKKSNNDTKFADLFELKAILNQSLKESFPFALFCSLVLIYVGYNSEHMEVDEGKQKVDLPYRKGEAIMLGSHNKPAEKTSQRNFADKAESEFSNSRRKLNTGQMFESRGMRLVTLNCIDLTLN